VRGFAFIVCGAATVVIGASSASADVAEIFYPHDFAKTVFNTPEKVSKTKLTPGVTTEAQTEAPAEETPFTDTLAEEKPQEELSEGAQKLVATYGDPDKDFPVKAQDNAPQPFKAMMEALAAKEDDMAFRYARQWARYQRDVKERTQRVVGLTGLAMEREGMLGEDSWQSSKSYDVDRKLVERDLERDKANREEQYRAKLTPELRDLLRRAEVAEAQTTSEGGSAVGSQVAALKAPIESEAETRARIRKGLTGRVPTDPRGEVDVYLFFRANDSTAKEPLLALDALHKQTAELGKIRVSARLLDQFSLAVVQQLKARQPLQLAITAGKEAATKLGVRSSPTLVFVCRSTGAAVMEEGPRSKLYIDEVISIMQGGRL